MSTIIRIPGLIAFFVLTTLLAIITVVFLDTWIKAAAINGLEEAAGAEVNIGSVSHTFSPFGVTIRELQITDPNMPTRNQFQAQEITAQLSLMPLLMDKVIIDDLVVSGIQFQQLREEEGEVYIDTEAADGVQGLLPEGIEVPSVDDILAKSPLKTTKAVEDAQNSYDRHNENLQAQYANLPTQEKLEEYKARLTALKDTEYKDPVKLASAKQEFDAILAELKVEREKLSNFKTAVQDAKSDMSAKLANLKAAPGQDYDTLQALIAGDADAINDVTRHILGDKAAIFSDYLLSAYTIAGPMMVNSSESQEQERADGRWIEFSDELPLPNLLIRKALISLLWQDEEISSEWKDITYQHERIGRPTVFEIDSTASKLWDSLQVKGNFQLLNQLMTASQDWDLKGLSLNGIRLLDEQALATKIDTSRLDSKGSLTVKDSVFSGGGEMNLKELAMTARGSNQTTELIANTLNGLNRLSIQADLTGSIENPSISLSSDLDRQLGKALLGNLSPEQTSKLSELKQKLTGISAGPLDEKNGQVGKWQDWEKLIDSDIGTVDDLLKSQLNELLDQDELKDKLKEKLFG